MIIASTKMFVPILVPSLMKRFPPQKRKKSTRDSKPRKGMRARAIDRNSGANTERKEAKKREKKIVLH